MSTACAARSTRLVGGSASRPLWPRAALTVASPGGDSNGDFNSGGVACPTAKQSTAVDEHGNEVTFNPSAAGDPKPVTIDSGRVLASVACPSVRQRTAVDGAGGR